jgi:uncharacterized protein (DUF1697 family)
MTECIALLRGINVGRAKRVAMADLRELVGDLGYANVRTVLNSGNVVFGAARGETGALAAAIAAGIEARFGFASRVVVVTAAELAAIVRENPLLDVATNPSRLLVAFVANPAALDAAGPLLRETWAPDALAVGRRAAYLWCADGVLDSPLSQAFGRRFGEAATIRNWSTVLKLHAAASRGES